MPTASGRVTLAASSLVDVTQVRGLRVRALQVGVQQAVVAQEGVPLVVRAAEKLAALAREKVEVLAEMQLPPSGGPSTALPTKQMF